MGKPAARITDFHACPMVTPGTPPIPHVGGPIIKGSFNVLTGKLPQARVGDMAICVGPPDTIVKGSSGVFVNKMPAARIGDSTAHGGTIVAGLPTVIIGESKSISGGGAAVPKGALMLAYSDFVAQLKVLIDAQRTGAPFCEACFKAAMADGEFKALIEAGASQAEKGLKVVGEIGQKAAAEVAAIAADVKKALEPKKPAWSEDEIRAEWGKTEKGREILKKIPVGTKFEGYEKKPGDKANASYSLSTKTIRIPNNYTSYEAAPTAAHEALHAYQHQIQGRPKDNLDRISMEVEAKNLGLDIYDQMGRPSLPYDYKSEIAVRDKDQKKYNDAVTAMYKKLYRVK